MVIRHNNAKAKDNHLSIKGLPSDLGEAKSELKSRIEEIDIDKNIIGKYQSQVDKLKNLKKDLKGLVDRFNTDVDKLANGAMVISIKKGEEVDYLVQTEDEMLDQLNKTKEINDKINQLNEERKEASKERQAEIDAEIANKKAEREETYKYASGLVDNMASAAVDMTKGVISGDPDKMVDTILGALAGIFSFLTKGIALGITSFKSAWDKHKAGEKLNDEDLKMLEQVQVDVVSEGSITSDPMTSDELDEVNQDISDAAFEGVGKITDWESAFAYGYAKLKQIHGINYNEAKAKEVLEGLKKKYPDNPKVVIGALKFGGHHKAKSDEEKNSKTSNSSKIYAMITSIDEGDRLSGMSTGPFKSVTEAKSKLGFHIWTEETGCKARVELVPESLVDKSQGVSLSEFKEYWNKYCKGIASGTDEMHIYVNSRVVDFRQVNSREKVDEETLNKAKESGVIQQKPNGSWGIISLEKGEWWVPDYESEESAKNALKAYHAGRFGNSDLRDEARSLFRQLTPEISDEECEKLINFGFGLAADPEDLIESLKEQISKKGKNSNMRDFRRVNSKGTKYYGLFYVTSSYHNQDGNLVALNASNLDEAIKESAEYIKKVRGLADKFIWIVEDTVPYKKSLYVYSDAPSSHSNWHGSKVAKFVGKYEGKPGFMYITFEGIENPDNWIKITGRNSRMTNSGVSLCTFYIDKFNKKELGDLFIKFGEKIKEFDSRELVISQGTDPWDKKSVVSLRIKDTRYNTSFDESLMAER